ncbi:hypothetical protein LG59_1537 [Serratia ureilytica]|uniref:hypothetical protein n=1 Tax=Serratia ureilytica TaxID=300181 RepID=UPI0006277748|nr:hypothetical protein [Serratia ureilytica]KKO60051.1 hypothetical protein LG59_1537 [Serratia ureilytica]MBH2704141.1 hypothetical protein [Serratia marcescens]MBN5179824.1 hypothetical protein [Serratia marcescens]
MAKKLTKKEAEAAAAKRRRKYKPEPEAVDLVNRMKFQGMVRIRRVKNNFDPDNPIHICNGKLITTQVIEMMDQQGVNYIMEASY